MSVTDQLRVLAVSEPMPRSRLEGELTQILDGLAVGAGVDIPKGVNATRAAVYRYRNRKGEGSFVIRDLRPGWTRVWRSA
jgi:hypothetical protein